jgi:hypothetical protein
MPFLYTRLAVAYVKTVSTLLMAATVTPSPASMIQETMAANAGYDPLGEVEATNGNPSKDPNRLYPNNF